MSKRSKRHDNVFIVIHLSKVRETLAIDYIGGSACYWVIRKALLPIPVAFLASIAGPMAIRLLLQVRRGRLEALTQVRRKLIVPKS